MPDSLQLYRQADAELARLSGIDAANPAQLQSDLDLLLRIVAHLRAIAVAIRPTNGEITAGASSPAGTIRAYAVEDVASIAGTHGGGGGGGALSLISQAAAEAGTEETARSVSGLRLKQAFDAYLAAWVGAAPGALNTLDELAAALSDDANFASTVTTALAGKLNSSAVSAFILTLLDDADAAAVRTTIGAGTVATGAVDNAVLRADGMGGVTTQPSPVIVGDATTYSSQVYVQTRVDDGSTTNIHKGETPKGTGAFIVGPPPDGTATGGNNRGANAADLGPAASAVWVASGAWSLRGPGAYGSTGLKSVALAGAHATNTGSVAIMEGAQSTGTFGLALGPTCSASATVGIAVGGSATADRYGMFAQGLYAAGHSSQFIRLLACVKTTNATPTELRLDGSSARITIPSGKVQNLLIQITGAKSDGSAVANYTRQIGIKNVAGTTSLVGTEITIGTDVAASTSIAITADDTNDALAIAVTGIAAETWRWCAVISGVEIAYGT
jgi:hypothetical protein